MTHSLPGGRRVGGLPNLTLCVLKEAPVEEQESSSAVNITGSDKVINICWYRWKCPDGGSLREQSLTLRRELQSDSFDPALISAPLLMTYL